MELIITDPEKWRNTLTDPKKWRNTHYQNAAIPPPQDLGFWVLARGTVEIPTNHSLQKKQRK